MTSSSPAISNTFVITKPSHSNTATETAVMATTMPACLASLHDKVANSLLSFARNANTRPKKIVRPATIFGIKPEPGSDNVPVGRSPLSAMIKTPTQMKKAPATWSARNVMNISPLW